jgi:hypothetical protein
VFDTPDHSCFHKKRYESKSRAKRALRSMLLQYAAREKAWREERSLILEEYACPHCEGWHVGHRREKPLPTRSVKPPKPPNPPI